MRPALFGPALVCLALALPAWAQTLDDRHLPTLPRTPAEAARIAAVLAPPTDFSAAEPFEALSAGAATVRARTGSDAFSQPSANMAFDRQMTFLMGNALFTRSWVPAPASTRASDGLGPVFNARGCQDCHLLDGRGHPPAGTADSRVSMILRLSVPARVTDLAGTGAEDIAEWLATAPEPHYGAQVQDLSNPGLPPEGRVEVDYTPLPVRLGDGTTVTLRAPTYSVSAPSGPPLAPGTMLSPRVAPQMIGLGLLEAIPAADILALADPDDRDGDGISGRAQIVPSVEYGVPMLGRFGLKAGAPTLREQSAAAFAADMGLSSPLHPDAWGDCLSDACRDSPSGAEDTGAEVSDDSLDLVTFYARNLGVPARRDVDDRQVLAGKAAFHAMGCAACHQPNFVTHRLEGQPEQSFQLIWPYTDLLLHDMGPGLADNRPEGRATGQEWKTPPLWGIGLTQAVSGHTQFLHDGRARDLTEAILWHGGEALAARNRFATATAKDRAALLAFLNSL